MSKKKTPKPAFANLDAFAKCVASDPDGVIEKVTSTDAPHIHQGIDAGLWRWPASPANDTKVVKLTDTNLSVLAECIKKGGGTIGRVVDADAPHLRRCLKAGALVSGATRGTWVLSTSGAAMLAEYEARTTRARSPR